MISTLCQNVLPAIVKPSLVSIIVRVLSAKVLTSMPLVSSFDLWRTGVTCWSRIYCNRVLSLRITFLYSSSLWPMNFSKALSVGAKTVKGPEDWKQEQNQNSKGYYLGLHQIFEFTLRASVKSALSIKSAKMFDPKSLSCSGMSLGVIGGKVGRTKLGLGVAHRAGIYCGGIGRGCCCWDGRLVG